MRRVFGTGFHLRSRKPPERAPSVVNQPLGDPTTEYDSRKVTDGMVDRGAAALTARYQPRLGIVSRAVVYRHPSHREIALAVLVAALDEKQGTR